MLVLGLESRQGICDGVPTLMCYQSHDFMDIGEFGVRFEFLAQVDYLRRFRMFESIQGQFQRLLICVKTCTKVPGSVRSC